jgi:hypothetical protein
MSKIPLKLLAVNYGEKSVDPRLPWMIETDEGVLWFTSNSFKTKELADSCIDYYFSWNQEYERKY